MMLRHNSLVIIHIQLADLWEKAHRLAELAYESDLPYNERVLYEIKLLEIKTTLTRINEATIMHLPHGNWSRNQKLEMYKQEVERLEAILDKHDIDYSDDTPLLDTSEYTISELEAKVADIEDIDMLKEALKYEGENQARTGAQKVLAARIKALVE